VDKLIGNVACHGAIAVPWNNGIEMIKQHVCPFSDK
jgi:hypothetical protein